MSFTSRRAFDVLFLGSDTFSIGSLNALLKRRDLWQTLQVVTPASKPIGRRKKAEVYQSELARVAREQDLSTTEVQYEGFRSWVPPEPFHVLSPSHLLVTASFGAILPKATLSLFPPHQKLNVHPSLLPKYRGASPIQYAIMNRDPTTGVTVQELSERGADTGAIFAQGEFRLPPRSTYGSVVGPLADLGSSLLVKTLEDLRDGKAPTPQSSAGVIKAPKIRKEMAIVDFSRSASEIEALHRAVGHQLTLRTAIPVDPPLDLLLHSISFSPISLPQPPGSCTYDPTSQSLQIACGGTEGGHLVVTDVQVEGRKRVDARTGWAGLKDRGVAEGGGWVRLGGVGD